MTFYSLVKHKNFLFFAIEAVPGNYSTSNLLKVNLSTRAREVEHVHVSVRQVLKVVPPDTLVGVRSQH